MKPGAPSERVTFSFDSAGWLYVYQLPVLHKAGKLGVLPLGLHDSVHGSKVWRRCLFAGAWQKQVMLRLCDCAVSLCLFPCAAG